MLRCLWKRRCRLRFTVITIFVIFSGSTFYLSLLAGDGLNGRLAENSLFGSSHQLAVIVPFRDRFDELLHFLPHMKSLLDNQSISHKFYIINQVDIFRFNRASLINVGFLLSYNECDYIVMHDIDLLPLNPRLRYSYPSDGPLHLASPELHPMYHYQNYVGGILVMTTEQFRMVNGLSNTRWGWGREDDEFYVRIKESGLQVQRPVNITTGNRTFLHIHDTRRRKRDNHRYGDQKAVTRKRDRLTGLDTVSYSIASHHTIRVDDAVATVFNVHLRCNIRSTPWCLTPDQLLDVLQDVKHQVTAKEFENIKNDLREHHFDYLINFDAL